MNLLPDKWPVTLRKKVVTLRKKVLNSAKISPKVPETALLHKKICPLWVAVKK